MLIQLVGFAAKYPSATHSLTLIAPAGIRYRHKDLRKPRGSGGPLQWLRGGAEKERKAEVERLVAGQRAEFFQKEGRFPRRQLERHCAMVRWRLFKLTHKIKLTLVCFPTCPSLCFHDVCYQVAWQAENNPDYLRVLRSLLYAFPLRSMTELFAAVGRCSADLPVLILLGVCLYSPSSSY